MKTLLLVAQLCFVQFAFAHQGHHHHDTKVQNTLAMKVLSIEDRNEHKYVEIFLTNKHDNTPISLSNLAEAHTKKIHLLIIDKSLVDYHHIHPQATNKAGIYAFKFKPSKNADYKIWADVLPCTTKTQEYVTADLLKGKDLAILNKTINLDNDTIDGLYKLKLSFENSLIKGQATIGNIKITSKNNKPVNYLEPVMNSYAHIVGFHEDFNSVIHIHPMGKEPKNESERGGPNLKFHIHPEKSGFIKLFVQIKINKQEYFVPFGINIQ